MKRNSKEIILEIRHLLDELESAEGKNSSLPRKPSAKKSYKGAVGSINMLIDEGFLDTLKEMALIMERLQEVGRHEKKTSISMALLNLTKRRELNRFKKKDTKNWEYVIRR